ncbi:MAG TPA: DNA sulfur modification protein DndB [Allosphingosinicella sp.]|nr:DNA sulfur modification protein DndB [Allosphingosinicella sp.]
MVAVYGGDPAWHALDSITPQSDDFDVDDVNEDAIASLGFLSLTGDELLFALDGQHRLAGIQRAIRKDRDLGDDEASVIFVSHRNDAAGLRRTRALFTTLNKTAKAVTKGEIIALDEADVMAITARRLVEDDRRFSAKRILIAPAANLPQGDQQHLTTIVNLYDVLTILFSKVMQTTAVADLKFNRPSDEALEAYLAFASRYLKLLGESFPEVGRFFKAKAAVCAQVVAENRHEAGGSILFRPIGLTMFANVMAVLIKKHSLESAFEKLALLPTAAGPHIGG